ncbi:hypothetical protein, partial [Acetobacter sp. P1H12_c]|uniref:hypothetical protein n=1 Tax=Acetobacter sp. P1H12_c TaxID=2762621 RepID=UPI001C0400DC
RLIQTDNMVSQSCGNWDYYRFQDAYDGIIYKLPYLSFDRIAGRVGINRPDPKTSLHVVGQSLFATASKFDAYSLRFNAAVAINVLPGGDMSGNWGSTGTNSWLYLYGIGQNSLLGNWTSANELQLVDVNANKPMLTIGMEGSQRVSVDQLFKLPPVSKTAILAMSAPKDGDTVMCSDLGVPVVYSELNVGWFPLVVGAKLTNS